VHGTNWPNTCRSHLARLRARSTRLGALLLAAAFALRCAPSADESAGAIDTAVASPPQEFSQQTGALELLHLSAHQHPDSTILWVDLQCEVDRLGRLWIDSADAPRWLEDVLRRVDTERVTAPERVRAQDAMARRQFLTTSEAGCAEAARAGRLGDTAWIPLTALPLRRALDSATPPQ
jgi:hypothetical protein